MSLLRSLAAVHAEGGIRPAARRLGVEHSAVSRAMRELEATFGVPLTEPRRRGEKTVLTPHATDLANAALAALQALEKAVAQFRAPTSSTHVTIATLPSIAARWLLPRMPDFRKIYPSVDVSIIVDQPRGAEIDTAYDLTIRMGFLPRNTDGITILGDDIAFPVIAPSLWDRSGRPDDIAALKTLRLLHDRDSEVNWTLWRDRIGPADLDIRSGPRMTSSDLALQAAEQAEGVAVCRGWLAAGALSSGTLVRPFGDLSIPLPSAWWLCEGRRARKNHAVRKVREWLGAVCAGET